MTSKNSTMPLSKVSNLQIILRLLTYMAPFNRIMISSLVTRVIKCCGQATVLGIAAASVGLYISSAEPGVVNWDVIWQQVRWIAFFGVIVGFTSYIENYTGHYVAFRILAEFRDKFYYAMLPLPPARTRPRGATSYPEGKASRGHCLLGRTAAAGIPAGPPPLHSCHRPDAAAVQCVPRQRV